MKNVLFISYFFSPLGGPGVQRSVKFCKYLPECGWNPIVLTVKDISYIAYDETLESEVSSLEIHRAGSCDIMRILYKIEKLKSSPADQSIYTKTSNQRKQFFRDIFPIDSKIGWIPFAVREGNKICRTQKIDAIYSTVGPYSDAIVGYKISKKYNIPLIVDYRDLFVGSPDESYFSPWHKRFAYMWERKVLTRAQWIIINTNRAKEKIQKFYPMIDKEKFTVIYNGYDREDYVSQPTVKDTSDIYFTYTGGFYGDRTPEFLVKAISELKKEKAIPQNVIFQFIGNYSTEIESFLKWKTAAPHIVVHPQVIHRDVIDAMLRSDFLLLLISHKDSEIVIPAKLFEYFAARRPVFGMCPTNGEAAGLIKKYNAGIVCETRDVKKIKELILFLINIKQIGKLGKIFACGENDYSYFERAAQTKELAQLLNT